MADKETIKVTNNEAESRFEAVVEGVLAVAAYDLAGGTMTFTHTGVPPELGGRGIANQLARFGLDHARSRNLKVVPSCSFIAKYIEKNPEYQDLLKS